MRSVAIASQFSETDWTSIIEAHHIRFEATRKATQLGVVLYRKLNADRRNACDFNVVLKIELKMERKCGQKLTSSSIHTFNAQIDEHLFIHMYSGCCLVSINFTSTKWLAINGKIAILIECESEEEEEEKCCGFWFYRGFIKAHFNIISMIFIPIPKTAYR